MLGIKEPNEPQPLEQVKQILAKKRKFDEEIRSLVAIGNVASGSSVPAKKKHRV
jgi:hypothetical protein